MALTARIERQDHVDELSRPQQSVRIVEGRFQMDGAGLGIDGVVDDAQVARGFRRGIVARRDLDRAACGARCTRGWRRDAFRRVEADEAGVMRLMTTSATSFTFTRLPACTSRLPARPAMGARISQYARSSLARSTALSSTLRLARRAFDGGLVGADGLF